MEADNKVESIVDKQPAAAGREKSTIDFPYLDQENALEITAGVHAVGGSSCEWDQLAAHLKQAGNGGGFRARMISAKQYGLIVYDRGKVSLTSLGMRAVDPQQARAAKVESFLQVPLYRAIYDKYKGTTLPPAVALEREMQNLGVPSKQTDKARQAFQRSARSAGFFDFGAERLVLPANSQPQQNQDTPTPPPQNPNHGGNGGGGESRSVALKSGGTLTISASTGFLALSAADRKFVFGLIDALDAYEQSSVQGTQSSTAYQNPSVEGDDL